ncbi:hypothetical protein FACS1894208_01260 [Clostridia bacterium]|nr:hypothetical protein FACS1894208_01260 [Clostridia bacterium]
MITLRWCDRITLIAFTESQNEAGYTEREETGQRPVFADKRSVYQSEYFAARNQGLEISIVFIIYKAEYGGEKTIEHEGVRYSVVRTFADRKNIDLIELHCSKDDIPLSVKTKALSKWR